MHYQKLEDYSNRAVSAATLLIDSPEDFGDCMEESTGLEGIEQVCGPCLVSLLTAGMMIHGGEVTACDAPIFRSGVFEHSARGGSAALLRGARRGVTVSPRGGWRAVAISIGGRRRRIIDPLWEVWRGIGVRWR